MLSQLSRGSIVAALALAALAVFAAMPGAGAGGSFTVAATASPSQITAGDTTRLSVTATNTTTPAVRADVVIAVTDPSGVRVYGRVWSRQRMNPNIAATFTTDYTSPGDLGAGIYSVRVTIQSTGGRSVYYDNAATTTFQVSAAPPTPGATPSPTATNTPTPTATPAPTATPVPGPDSVYLGVHLDGVPWNMTTLTGYETRIGKPVSIVHYWQFWSEDGQTLQPFHPENLTPIRNHGSIPMITWPSEAMGRGANQPAYSLGQIISGAYDSFIRSWATGAKNWGYPFFLRWGHEMNGNWFAWSETANGNQPGQFVLAWRRIHDIFTSVGANNVSWVWCPNVEFAGSTWPSYASLYPGDSYVDWTCLDGYNWGPSYPGKGGWISFSNLYIYSYNEMAGLAPGKPLMIGEWASTETGGSKANWITDAMTTQLPGYFPRIKAVVWYNRSADGMDWPIESSTSATAAYRAAVGSSYYASNAFGGLTASPIPPPN